MNIWSDRICNVSGSVIKPPLKIRISIGNQMENLFFLTV